MRNGLTVNGGLFMDPNSVDIGIPEGELVADHLQSVNFEDSVDGAEVYGSSGVPLGHSLGKYKAQLSMSITAESWYAWLQKLQDGYAAVIFPITIAYTLGNGLLMEVKMPECAIKRVKEGHSNSDGFLKVDIDFYCRYILRNNVCKYPISKIVPIAQIIGV